MKNPVVALLTDFGEDDFFVASLKGAILKINPLVQLIDITHQVQSFNVTAGSFILFSCYKYFPNQTIFLVVIDPGVGSSRKILLVETNKYYFIGPDNGVLTLALEEEEIKQIREVTNNKFFLPESSRTFEARDKMAPAAAWLTKGISSDDFGYEIHSYKKLGIKRPEIKKDEVIGHVLYIDKFGNLITNISQQMLERLREKTGKMRFCLHAGNRKIDSCRESYSYAKKEELIFLVGSMRLVEIAARETSAAGKLKSRIGDEIRIKAIE